MSTIEDKIREQITYIRNAAVLIGLGTAISVIDEELQRGKDGAIERVRAKLARLTQVIEIPQ